MTGRTGTGVAARPIGLPDPAGGVRKTTVLHGAVDSTGKSGQPMEAKADRPTPGLAPRVPPETSATSGLRAGLKVLTTAVWLGLATGLLEVGVLVARHALVTPAALGSLQLNRHFPWMIPVAQLGVFLAAGAPIALLAVVRPSAGRRVAAYVLTALPAFCLLLTVRGLYTPAAVVLAVGLAWRLGPRLERAARRVRRPLAWSLPLLAGIVAALGLASYDRVVRAEARALAALPQPAPDSLNVLLIVLDTVRADRLSLDGYDRDTTPNLARLARRGVVFREARSAAPWTLPSHANLFTGRWPHELNVGPERPLGPAFPTLAEYLSKNGYASAGFVANTYFCNSWFGLARGFVHYEDYYEENVSVSAAEALRCAAVGRKLIGLFGGRMSGRPGAVTDQKNAEKVNRDFLGWLSRNEGRRFFAFLNYVDAHDPYMPPQSFDRHFGRVPETHAERLMIHSWNAWDKKTVNPDDVALVNDAYDDCLAYLDEQLGRLFDGLESQGVLDKTLVVVTSDHGESLGEHGLFGHGLSLYRPEIRVPLVIVSPEGVPRGLTVPDAVSLRDVAATVVDRLGLAGGSPFPGRTLARFWSPSGNDTAPSGDPALSEVTLREKPSKNASRPPAHRGPLASVTVADKVYIRDAMNREELFDINDDPDETRNLARNPSESKTLERGRTTFERMSRESIVKP